MCASRRERVHCQSSKWTLVELTGTNLLSSLRGHRCLTAAIVALLLSCCQCNWLAGSLGNTGTAVANIQGFQRDAGCHSPWMGREWKSCAEQVVVCACTHTHTHTHTHTGLHHCWHVHLAPSKRGAQLLLKYCPLLDTVLPEVRIH